MQQRTKSGISYQVQGQGEPLLMIHGLSRTAQHWLDYDKELAANFRVIIYDARGFGNSQTSCSWSMTIEDMAKDAIDILDELNIERCHILGVSLGGIVTLACGINFPERCLSLIVINSLIVGQSKKAKPLTPEARKFIRKSFLFRIPLKQLNRELTDLILSADCPDERRDQIAERLLSIIQDKKPIWRNIFKQMFAVSRYQPKQKLSSIRIPTLILYGTHDIFVPPINSEKIAESIPGARLVAVPKAGHEFMFDKGDELTRILRQWNAQYTETQFKQA